MRKIVIQNLKKLFGLLLLDFVYFIWVSYPKGILVSLSSQSSMQDCFSRLFYYVLYIIWVLYCEPQDYIEITGKSKHKRKLIYIVRYIIRFEILYCIMDLVFIISIFYCVNKNKTCKVKVNTYNIILYVFSLGVFFYLSYSIFKLDGISNIYHEKYTATSYTLLRFDLITSLNYQLIFICWSMISHILVVYDNRWIKHSTKSNNKKIYITKVKYGLVLYILIIFAVFKPLLLPVSLLNQIESFSGEIGTEINDDTYYHESAYSYYMRADKFGISQNVYCVTSPTTLRTKDEFLIEIEALHGYSFNSNIIQEKTIINYGPCVVIIPHDKVKGCQK